MRKSIFRILFPVILCWVFSGCTSDSMVVLIPDPDGHVGQVTVANQKGQRVLTDAYDSVNIPASQKPLGNVKKLSDKDIYQTFSEAMDALPTPPDTFILYFLFNSHQLTPESENLIPEIIRTIQERESTDIMISGHTDKMGPMESNSSLSLERAVVIRQLLETNGVQPEYISVASHGEGNPLIQTDDEVPEPRNRRVEVVVR